MLKSAIKSLNVYQIAIRERNNSGSIHITIYMLQCNDVIWAS